MQYLAIFSDIFEQGLIYSLLALGIYISFKVLNFPDLSVDGSFPFGAAVSTWALMSGLDPWTALVLATFAGAIAGAFTGFLHEKLRINALFAGIITMTLLYSVNLLVVGRANQSIFDKTTIFKGALSNLSIFDGNRSVLILTVVGIIVLIIKFALDYYFRTKAGLLLRATGDNEQIVKSLAVKPGSMRIIGLSLANALVALSGAVLSQQQGYFEISMGTGAMVTGLASCIIGLVIFSNIRFLKVTTQVILGSIVYKALVALAINLGTPAFLLNMVRALLFLLILMSDQVRIPLMKSLKINSRTKGRLEDV